MAIYNKESAFFFSLLSWESIFCRSHWSFQFGDGFFWASSKGVVARRSRIRIDVFFLPVYRSPTSDAYGGNIILHLLVSKYAERMCNWNLCILYTLHDNNIVAHSSLFFYKQKKIFLTFKIDIFFILVESVFISKDKSIEATAPTDGGIENKKTKTKI